MTIRYVISEDDLRTLLKGKVVQFSGSRHNLAAAQEVELCMSDIGFDRIKFLIDHEIWLKKSGLRED